MLMKLWLAAIVLLSRHRKTIFRLLMVLLIGVAITFVAGKIYQRWDDDPTRGAIALTGTAYSENFLTPRYLNQGWSASDSLWFYNTTQGSGLLPYDFFLVLEEADSEIPIRSPAVIDKFRYLPQKATFFNRDALPIGFVKETYQGDDYVGFTCAACHTGQVNYGGQAIRIDGGPAMADLAAFLNALEAALRATHEGDKHERFINNVIALGNDYDERSAVASDLVKWTKVIRLYNSVNDSEYQGQRVDYGHARLDAFGRIYNRVLQHVINKRQLSEKLARITQTDGSRLLNERQINKVLDGVDEVVIGDGGFARVLERLQQNEPYPALNAQQLLRVRNAIFNSPNAPVSYPYLWDTVQSDFVQWNGLAANAGAGPLGRNAGEVIGVFGILDWQHDRRWFGLAELRRKLSLSALFSKQNTKREQIYFKSSIDLVNLQRLENHLQYLTSPKWPFCKTANGTYYLPSNNQPGEFVDELACDGTDKRFDETQVARGETLYRKYCLQCHELIDRTDRDRKVVAFIQSVNTIRTDIAMANNSVSYTGASGNFRDTYQDTDTGTIVLPQESPVAPILSAATKGAIATPDPDKFFIRRWADWLYIFGMTLAQNDIKKSAKRGNYAPSTSAKPFNALLAYKARALNGIWAAAPYLHNGSVPSLYDLLLPVKEQDSSPNSNYRPEEFYVGAREFDPVKVGFVSDRPLGTKFDTSIRGNRNSGHLYGVKRLTTAEREDLVEYLKTL